MFGRRKREPEGPPDAEEIYQRSKVAGRTPGPRDEQETLLRQAADLGHKVAMFDLGVLLERQHRLVEARECFEQAQQAGHILAERKLAALVERESERADSGDDAELARLKEDAEYGEPEAMTQYGISLWSMGRQTPGIEWLRRAAGTGHRPAVRHLAWVTRHLPGEQERLLRLEAEHGDVEGLRPWADHLRNNHSPDAGKVHEQLVRLGDPWALLQLGEIHERAGRIEEALRCYEQALAVPKSARSAHGALGRLLTELGRAEAAEPHLLASHGAGDFHLAWILEQRGDYAAAEELYRDLAESDIDQADAMAGLARMLDRRGEHDEARVWREESEGRGARADGPEWGWR
jgi:tetratricopeptide (TPR) repeat protein